MVVLYCFSFPLVCWWYSVEDSGTIQSSVRIAEKNFNVNCGPLYESITSEIPKFDSQWATNIVVTAVAVVGTLGNAFVSSEYRSAFTTMNWFPDSFSAAGRLCQWPHTPMVRKLEAGKASFVCC